MGLFGARKAKEETGGGEVRLSDGNTYHIARKVDCIGDSCPRPQLMTKKAIGEVATDQVIEVLLDNPSSVEALPPMCDELGATHLETVKTARGWQVYIRKD